MSHSASTPGGDSCLPGFDSLPSASTDLSQKSDLESVQAALQENQHLKEQLATQTQRMHLLTHQLATPLTSLQGSVHLLAEASLSAEQRQEFLALLQQQVNRLQHLLQGLIELQDLETGGIATNPVAFPISQVIQESIATLQPSLTVNYQIDSALPAVWGDRWQVSQILINLLSNAVKYSPQSTSIEVGATCHQNDWVQVWVRDYGLGIPLADQSRLFERFYRVNHRDRQTIEGTGLGLSLCKLLVEKQGGKIGYESTHGEGSRFYFTLPIAKSY